jgi:hypothetical protein
MLRCERACEPFLKEERPKRERLMESDVMPYQNGSILAGTWRLSRMQSDIKWRQLSNNSSVLGRLYPQLAKLLLVNIGRY